MDAFVFQSLPPKPRCVRKLTHGGCVVNGFSWSIRWLQSVRWGLKMKKSLSRRMKKALVTSSTLRL
jgi:hypothetical protein